MFIKSCILLLTEATLVLSNISVPVYPIIRLTLLLLVSFLAHQQCSSCDHTMMPGNMVIIYPIKLLTDWLMKMFRFLIVTKRQRQEYFVSSKGFCFSAKIQPEMILGVCTSWNPWDVRNSRNKWQTPAWMLKTAWLGTVCPRKYFNLLF